MMVTLGDDHAQESETDGPAWWFGREICTGAQAPHLTDMQIHLTDLVANGLFQLHAVDCMHAVDYMHAAGLIWTRPAVHPQTAEFSAKQKRAVPLPRNDYALSNSTAK